MSLLTLTLNDFQTELPFSTQIEERQLRPFIHLAYELDLLPLLGYATLEALALLAPAPVLLYAAEAPAPVLAGDYLSRRERVFRALVPAPLLPVPLLPVPPGSDVSGQWAYEPLRTLWGHYLKKWWLHQSFSRFVEQHGINITKAGLTVPTDRSQGTYDRPSASERANLQASVATTAEALRSRLTRFLRDEHLLYQQTLGGCGYGYGYGEPLDDYVRYGPNSRAYAGHLGGLNLPARRHARRVRGI